MGRRFEIRIQAVDSLGDESGIDEITEEKYT
jgi:hypothetical protein